MTVAGGSGCVYGEVVANVMIEGSETGSVFLVSVLNTGVFFSKWSRLPCSPTADDIPNPEDVDWFLASFDR